MMKQFQKPWRDGLRAAIDAEPEPSKDRVVELSTAAVLHLLARADEADAMRAVLAAYRRRPCSVTARDAFEALVVECAEEADRE